MCVVKSKQEGTAVLCLELLCTNFLSLRKSHLSITLKCMEIYVGPRLHGRGGVALFNL
jgi:hypothetical protein